MKTHRSFVLLIAVVFAAFTLSFASGGHQAAAQDDSTPGVSTPGSVGPGGTTDPDGDDGDDNGTDPQATEDTSVKVLPSTGAGDSGSSMISYAAIVAGAALVAIAALASMRSRSKS